MISKPIAISMLVLFIVLSLCTPLAYAQEEPSKRVLVPSKHVLVLNSYNKGFTQTDDIVNGIESVLKPE